MFEDRHELASRYDDYKDCLVQPLVLKRVFGHVISHVIVQDGQ